MLTEKIYGDLATVFHRTSIKDLIDRVYTSGFKPGNGKMYGKGFYGTYDLESQETDYMVEHYGNIIVKFSVPIQDFIIFDEEEFRKTSNYIRMIREHSYENFLVWQIEDFSGNQLTDSRKQRIENFYRGGNLYTSDLADRMWSEISYHCNGIVFTGRNDGKVLVCYEPDLIIPLSYRIDGQKDFQKANKNLEYLSNYVDNKFEITHDTYDIFLEFQKLTELPKNIPNKIFGTFNCHGNNLTTLKGSPKEVGGNFYCGENKLISLKGAPIKVGGNFFCDDNNLTSLEGCPRFVGKDFNCSWNKLISLEGMPKEVGGDFYCTHNVIEFTEDQVREVCKVKGIVFV